jgi:histidyl-tRNA synthetase
VHKPTLVRGLDYYNKTVFEFVSNDLGAQNTFCGGGRYDHLVKDLGASQDQPSIGAAIGLERLILMLDLYKDRIALPQLPALHVIIPMASEQQALSLILADVLQAEDLCVEVLLEGDSVKSMMRKANKLGAAYCLILGSDEQATKTVTVKNMITGEEHRMPQVDVVKFLKQR